MGFTNVVTPDWERGRAPYVRFKWNANGGVRGYLSNRVEVETDRFFLELDEEKGLIRVKGAPGDEMKLSLALGKGRSRGFAIGKPAMRRIDTEERIYLRKDSDGWYYGSYREPNEYLLFTHGRV
ncbi:hypothetical protein [Buttiauxella sp. A111]|uniref:hypothetical protein n=1 Tax=Buttiauxella sp. A111 TaxID=2563088 RepID=UPI0010EE6B06|nr:hypothetical protein [Buttiauxella sp. A111]GDX06324.1 hypothetical protein BSPA111_25330 [Buttiauxella sp. A111]